ncbi:MAG: 50S ribosomal protein L15 [Spirochaetales bacterium]|nr:50S ribosomal protein L15 [Spirochaetales bacterium]
MSEFLLKVPKGARKNKKRIGRGSSSGTGCTAGKGNKGQNCRSGGGVRPGFEGGQMPLYRRIARRGFSNYPFKKKYLILNVDDLEKYKSGDTVSKETLLKMGIIAKSNLPIKLLARGEIKKKLIIELDKVSKQAQAKITKLGGEVKFVNAEKTEKKQAATRQKEKMKKQATKAETKVGKTIETHAETKVEIEKPEKPAPAPDVKKTEPPVEKQTTEKTVMLEEEKTEKPAPAPDVKKAEPPVEKQTTEKTILLEEEQEEKKLNKPKEAKETKE